MKGRMRVSIIGDGAMGLLFASYLSLSADVAVFSRRNERSELRNRNGITVLVKDGSRVFHPVFTTDKSMMAGSELVILFRNELGYERLGAQVDALFRAAAKDGRIGRTGNGRFKP